MCSIGGGEVPVWEDEVLDDAAWEQLVEQVRSQDEVSAWGRFSHLFTLDEAELAGSALAEPGLADVELLRRLRDSEALVTQLLAEQSRYLIELRRRRLAAQADAHPHPDGMCVSACCDDDGWVALEVGQELGLSERQVTARLDTAERLQRHPAVAAVMHDGRLQAWTATKLLEHLATLAAYVTPARLAEVEAGTLAWLLAGPRTVTQLNARMRRIVLAARAAAQADTSDDPDALGPIDGQRRVSVTPASTPGLAELVALLPEADALAVRATLLALAHDKADPDDPRTADQRRADLLVTLLTGRAATRGRPGDAQGALRDPVDLQVRLDVTVPASTLQGAGGAPALVPGYGAVPAATARALADASGCPARPLVYDPVTGRLLGFASSPMRMTWLDRLPAGSGYTHSPSLETAVRLRDGTCRAPGCTRRAARCDCDHVVPYPHGETSLSNTCSLCRRHHRLETHAPGWTVTALSSPDGGALVWTTPAGRTLATYPHDHRPPLPPGPVAGAAGAGGRLAGPYPAAP